MTIGVCLLAGKKNIWVLQGWEEDELMRTGCEPRNSKRPFWTAEQAAREVERYRVDEYEPTVRWAILPGGKTSRKHVVITTALIPRVMGATVQLVPGAPLLNATTAEGASKRDEWKKRQWMKRPRGFVAKPADEVRAMNTYEG